MNEITPEIIARLASKIYNETPGVGPTSAPSPAADAASRAEIAAPAMQIPSHGLMPGPLAAQLAIYLGFVHYGVLGATLVGFAFVLPSFLMVVALGWAYVQFGGIRGMQAVFDGVGAAVIGIITLSAYKLTLKTMGKHRLLWGIYVVSAAATIITESESILLFLGAGIIAWDRRVRRWRHRGGGGGDCRGLRGTGPAHDFRGGLEP